MKHSRHCRLRHLVVIALVLLAAGELLAVDIPFAAEAELPTGAFSEPWECDLADIDRDGDLDVLAVAAYVNGGLAGYVSWWANSNGDGSLWTRRDVVSDLDGARTVHAADIDRDGFIDILAAGYDIAQLVWLRNDGTPLDGGWTQRTIDPGFYAIRARTADMNGDGDLDVVAVSYSTDDVTWWENDGTPLDGGWTAHSISGSFAGARSLAIADLDEDGDLDAVAAGLGAAAVLWWENANGLGTSFIQHTVISSFPSPLDVELADIDSDGDIDVQGTAQGGTIAIWRNDGTPRDDGWVQQTVASTFSYAASVAVYDLDGDGDRDLLGVSYNNSDISWWENSDGIGSSWDLHQVTSTFTGAWDAAAGDLDGDGDLDLLAASYGDDQLSWWQNLSIHSSFVFGEATIISSTLWTDETVAADIDSDGDLDLAAAESQDDDICRWINTNGLGTAWTHYGISDSFGGATSVSVADVDGDGDLDVLGAAMSDDLIGWWEHPGSAKAPAWPYHAVSGSFTRAERVRAADMDGDGDQDVLGASIFDGAVWWENELGIGTSWIEHVVDAAARPGYAEAVDLDGDGDLDVLATDTDAIWWRANLDGSGGSWSAATDIVPYFDDAQTARAVDMDRDGDLDVVGAASFIGEVRWWENTAGDGSAWSEHVIDNSVHGVLEAYPVDLDGDGDVDVCAASYSGSLATCWENLGDGDSWSELLATAQQYGNSLYPADLDGDGDPDLISAGRSSLRWLPNRGGQIAFTTTSLARSSPKPGSETALFSIVANHRGRSGDGDAELVSLVLHWQRSSGVDLNATEVANMVASLQVYLDDGNGKLSSLDTLVTNMATIPVTTGRTTIPFSDGDPNVQVQHGTPRRYFVAVTLQPDADEQDPNHFVVSHLTTDGSTAEDRDHDIPLRVEYAATVSTTIVVIEPLFEDGFESGDTTAWSVTVGS